MKNFNELTQKGKDARLAKYAKENAKYGLKEALFRVTKVVRHADKDTKFGKVASFGFNIVPVKGFDPKDFKANTFTWANQLINLSSGQKVVDAMDQLSADLESTKSILVSITYKKSADGKYTNINSVYRRDNKPAQNTQAPEVADDELPM